MPGNRASRIAWQRCASAAVRQGITHSLRPLPPSDMRHANVIDLGSVRAEISLRDMFRLPRRLGHGQKLFVRCRVRSMATSECPPNETHKRSTAAILPQGHVIPVARHLSSRLDCRCHGSSTNRPRTRRAHCVGWPSTPAEASCRVIYHRQTTWLKVLRRPVECGQYTSEHFQELLKEQGITCSMSRAGEVWDNSAMESFFSFLEDRAGGQEGLQNTRTQARADVFDYIERFYNPTRRHSTLGYRQSCRVRESSKSLGRCPRNRQQPRRSSLAIRWSTNGMTANPPRGNTGQHRYLTFATLSLHCVCPSLHSKTPLPAELQA